jgi:hypothetical protein
MNGSPCTHSTSKVRLSAAGVLEDSALHEKVLASQSMDELFSSIAVINEEFDDIFMKSLLSEWDTDDSFGEFEGQAMSLDDQNNPSPRIGCTGIGDHSLTGSCSVPLSSKDSIVTVDNSISPSYTSRLSLEVQQLQRLSESMRRSEVTRAQVIRLREVMLSQLSQSSDERTLQNFSVDRQHGQALDSQILQTMPDWMVAKTLK